MSNFGQRFLNQAYQPNAVILNVIHELNCSCLISICTKGVVNPFMSGNYSTSVVWISHTFENNFGFNHKFTKYLKENCALDCYQHFSSKYFLKIAFVREIMINSKVIFQKYLRSRRLLSRRYSVIKRLKEIIKIKLYFQQRLCVLLSLS